MPITQGMSTLNLLILSALAPLGLAVTTKKFQLLLCLGFKTQRLQKYEIEMRDHVFI